ncbi:hypothetical protein M9Y10_027394 [Tritrichomonas musculus]|uniref:BEACH domain-containing protein n=1 Tax=Tritrichomonas musculus TaxID=1915356 RepID=A0ABR2H4Q9_9EUKA
MDSAFKTKEICQQILSLDINTNAIPSDLPDSKKQFIRQLVKNFPEDSTIRSVLKDLKTESFAEATSKLRFPIVNNNLERILKEVNLFMQKGVFEIFSLYAFYTWISTSILFLKRQKNDFSDLLSVLNHIVKITTKIPEKSQYHNISISCFVDIINTAVQNDTIDKYAIIFGEISEFFTENDKLLNHSDEIIRVLARKILVPENELSSLSIGILNSVTIILNRNPKILSQNVINSIVKLSKSFIINLDEVALKFFLYAANYIKKEDFESCFKPLMLQTLTNVVSNYTGFKEDIEKVEDGKEKVLKKHIPKDSTDYFHPPIDLYQINNVDDSNIITTIKVDPLKSFINPQMLQIVNTIEQMILLNEEYAQYFLTEAIEDLQSLDSTINLIKNREYKSDNEMILTKKIFYEQCAIVFYLVSTVIKKYPKVTIENLNDLRCPLFNNKNIFDPKVTLFSQNDNFSIINSLRHFTFRFLLDKNQSSLNDVLRESSIFPELFRECLFRLCLFENMKNKVINEELCFVSDSLIVSFVDYRIELEPPYLNDDNNFILLIRKTLLLYFNSFFSNDFVLEKVFCSPVFVSYFFVLLMEPPIRQQFIGFLLRYLSTIKIENQPKKKSNEVLECLCQSIIQLFTVACKELQQKESLSLLSDVLNSLNEAIIFNKSLTDILEPISSDLCHNIMSININSDETEHMEDLLLSLISFLAGTSHDKTIKANDISLLESTIIHLTKTKPQSKIMQKLVQVIAGKQISFILPTFEIKQSKVLCSFVRIFLETNHIYKVVKFISDLCSYSSENCIKCHDGELDLLLIDIVNKWRKTITEIVPEKPATTPTSSSEFDLNTNYFNDAKNDDTNIVFIDNKDDSQLIISEKLIDLFLGLFSQIASVVSSVSVVQRFFSMLCPIDAKYLSSIHKNIINSLNKILITSRYFPLAALPMIPSGSIQIHNIPINSFENGISFVFWISMPSNIDDFAQSVLVLDDGKKHKFKVQIIERKLRVKIQSGVDYYHYDFQLSLPIKTWSMISITTTPNPNGQESSVTLYVNKEQVKVILKFALFMPKSAIECLINHPLKMKSTKKLDPPLMGLFLLSKQLVPEEIAALSDEGPRPSLSSIATKIIFAYSPIYVGKYIQFKPIQKVDEISETHPQIVSCKKSLSFYDLLINYCKVYLILPIFGQLDIPLKDGSQFQFMADLAVEILVNLFNLGEQAQYSFFVYNGFFAIAHLLQNSDNSNITFNLYMRYFNLLGTITYKNLQMQLIDAILMNFDLWSKSEIKHQVRILKHWSRTVYIPFKYMIDLIRPLEWFLFAINRYYEFPNSEEKIHYDCRKSLFEIAYESFKTNFSTSHTSIIMGFICARESSMLERKEMTNFLTTLLRNKEVIINANIRVSQIIPFIFTVLNGPDKDDDLISQILSLFIVIYKTMNYEVKTPLYKLIQNVINSLYLDQGYIFQEVIYTSLITLMNANNVVELLPLLCINAILGGPKYLALLLKNIDRKLNYFISEQSTIYPALLLFAYVSDTYLYQELISMNITLFKKQIEKLINAISAIGYSCFDPYITDQIKHDVLYKIARHSKSQQEESFLLIRIVKDFIFFRLEKTQSSILTHLIINDPFEDSSNNVNEKEVDDEMGLNDDENEIPINSSSPQTSLINPPSSSFPINYQYPIQKSIKHEVPSSFDKYTKGHVVKFDLDAVGPVSSMKQQNNESPESESYKSDDTFDYITIPGKNDYICDPLIIKVLINMNEIISNAIKTGNSDKSNGFKYKFGLRFNNNDGKWLDLDLAKSIISVYKINKAVQYAEVMRILAHFIYKYDQNFVNKVSSALTAPSGYPEMESFIKEDTKSISIFNSIENTVINHDDMLSHQVLIFATSYCSFAESCFNSPTCVDKNDMIELITVLEMSKNNFNDNLERLSDNNRKIWSRHWRSLTITRAPWADSLPKVTDEGFKRDNSFCFAYCPYKVRKIRRFDKHIKASMIRDIGDKKKAERKLKMMIQEPPKSLLFCAIGKDEKEAEKRKDNNNSSNANNNNDDKSDSNTNNNQSKQTQFNRIENLEKLECKLVTIKGEKNALIKIDMKTILITTENKTKVISSDNIYSIFYVFKYHKYSGIQIFTKLRENFFLIFDKSLFRSLIPNIRCMPSVDISRIQSQNPKPYINSLHITDRWIEGKLSNFEYLMYLNLLSGRSFNDATQYPIFPWIIKDFESDTIDLNSPSIYRDLSKPVGAIDQQRLNDLLSRWNEIEEIERKPYLYGSGYSNPLSVYLWLIRLEPFTTQHIDIQGGKFDYAARIFRSIKDSFINATTNQNDYRELIPEFFFLPEFLKNMSRFDLGKTDDGDVDDVMLPPWSKNSAINFIYLHRKALESDYVSAHLNEWIDLIWGNKQDGEAAIKAHNVFRAEMYDSIWKEADINETEIKAIQSNVGQIPLKLFDERHPKRNARSKSFVNKSSISTFNGPISSLALSLSSSTSLATYASSMDSISPTISSQLSIQTSSSAALGVNMNKQNETNKKFNSINNQIHHSIVKFFEVSSTATADVTVFQQKGKFLFTILDSKGNIYLYSVDFTLFKSQKFVVRAKNFKKIKVDQEESSHLGLKADNSIMNKSDAKLIKSANKIKVNKVSFSEETVKDSQSIYSPKFIDSKRLCFIDKNASSVKIVNCQSGCIEKSIEQNFGIVSIETDSEGWLAISAKDAAVTVYNVNHLPNDTTTENSSQKVIKARSDNLNDLRSRYDYTNASSNSDSIVYFGSISSFRESIKCIALNPTFDALICGTRDNWLLFCRLNIYKMNVNRMVETKGRPQNIIVTDGFGFVAVSITKFKNGDLFEKLVLYSINGEKIRSVKLEEKKRIMAMTKASSLPGAFDFLIVADSNNCIYVFEAFYLNFGEPIFRCNSKIKKLTYVAEESLIIAFCEDGTAAVIYYPINL